ncbi:MAG: beta-glucosidase [Rhodanobacter sp.]|nr:MAG: beta-glucosidase [Rhodanobacter sp.]
MNLSLRPDKRAHLLEAHLTQAQKFRLIRSDYGSTYHGHGMPHGALGSAGYVPGIPSLKVPALQETDAGMGVAKPHPGGEGATSLPSGLASAASWDPKVEFDGGAMIGAEAHAKGFDVLLAGGVDLLREPRNGRNFEYAGEDPLLAGTMVAQAVRGIQSQHVISTVKHYAINDQETGRTTISSELNQAAMRESDLLAFHIVVTEGHPGAVMCSYNRVNGTYACENKLLLDQILKQDWGFRGFVMSDWGGTHSATKAAMAGLDQESAAADFDKQVYFGKPLRAAVADGAVPQSRIDDMVHRILRSMFAVGVFDHPPHKQPIAFATDRQVAQKTEEAGAVLLRNRNGLLPLSVNLHHIVLIGTHADKGVLSGGGSSTVRPSGGNVVQDGRPAQWPGPPMYLPSSPLAAFRRLAPKINVQYDSGANLVTAARAAAKADVAIVFVHQWMAESFDRASLELPNNQNALVEAVAAANPRTIVVLENGGPIAMPWLHKVDAVLEAWYPGAGGGPAIARLLFGMANPSGHLPLSWPVSLSQLPRPKLPAAGYGNKAPPPTTVDYNIEGPDVGYRWYQKRRLNPLFPFGFGLSYTHFAYTHFYAHVHGSGTNMRVVVDFDIRNTGKRSGEAVPQIYGTPPNGDTTRRLVAWTKLSLAPGQNRYVHLVVATRSLAHYDALAHRWQLNSGKYKLEVAHNAMQADAQTALSLSASTPLL